MADQKVIFFGTGRKLKYEKEKHPEIFKCLHVVAYLDNDRTRHKELLDGIPILAPEETCRLEYDKIILMADYVKDMWQQLMALGVPSDKIFLWSQFVCENRHGVFVQYGNTPHNAGKKVLIISTDLNYNGGTIAVLYAAKALLQHNYSVTVSAPSAGTSLIEEMKRQKICLVVAPAIHFPQKEEAEWISRFDIVIVNVFQMLRCACIVSKIKPVLWWLHESSARYTRAYPLTKDNHWEYDNVDAMKYLNIMAVSNKAKENFNHYYKSRIQEILPYGIPDTYIPDRKQEHERCVFAVVGEVYQLKAQKIFLEAVEMLTKERNDVEFLFIGKCGNDPYASEVKRKAGGIPEVKMLGELTREQMRTAYEGIDIVVCSSLEETMSLTVTEGMMLGKICIVTNAAGVADFMEDGVNGLICKAGSADELYRKMKWVLEHTNQWEQIRKQARKTYERYFTMEKFGIRLQKAIEETILNYALS